MAILAETGLAPECLVLEVTESALMENVAHVRALLASMRNAGITIALDDFGAGYSSLGQLRQLPIDVLKIDRALVPDVAAGAESASITRAIITMASSLRLQVLAEGVETRSQVDMLTNSGCHLMQGYFLSRPLQESELVKLLARHSAQELPKAAMGARHTWPRASALAILQLTF
jgi:EAL domain-containing protein (putative c-di-GMP-specific phosphodiesterase class I)